MLGFYTPYVYLPALAVSAGGVAVEDANFLISIIGISNTVARVLAGWVSGIRGHNSTCVLFKLCD
jgi:predicted MFS family arabinose efflux permease